MRIKGYNFGDGKELGGLKGYAAYYYIEMDDGTIKIWNPNDAAITIESDRDKPEIDYMPDEIMPKF